MREFTQETVKRLLGYPWFAHVLQSLDVTKATAACSWEDAVATCSGEVWRSVQLQVTNRFARELSLRSYARYQEWGRIAPELSSALMPIIDVHVKPVAKRHDLPESFLHSVHWDLTYVCLEAEYTDVPGPLFFLDRVDEWYRRGRFPCGWEGPKLDTGLACDLPKYKLIVL